MKNSILLFIAIVLLWSCTNKQEPALRQGNFYTEEEGKTELKKLESMYNNSGEWESRKQMLRENILKGLNLSPASMYLETSTNHLMIQKNIRRSSLPTDISTGILWEPGGDYILTTRYDVPLWPVWEQLSSATACTDGEVNRPDNLILQP
jgi:hypothetical protein